MAQSFSIEAVLSARDEGFIAGMEHANKATQSLGKTIKSGIGFGALMNVGSRAVDIVIRGISSITSHTDAAISRVDTLNNFPIIMKNLGYSTKDATKALDKMNKGIDGLPTSMDAIASATQKIAPLTGSLSEATDVTLALNDALLAGGKSTEAQSNALEQYSQMLAAGKVDMQGWRSMMDAMPGQLDQVAKSLLGAKAGNMDLYEAMKSGEISFGDFNKALLDLDKNGLKVGEKAFASFADQAKDATKGIQTSMTNVGTAVTKGLANTINSVNDLLEKNGLPTISGALDKVKDMVNNAFNSFNNSALLENLVTGIPAAIEGVKPYFETLKESVSQIATVFGEAFSAIGGNIDPAAMGADALSRFQSAVSTATDALTTFAGFLTEHADVIGAFVQQLPRIVEGFLAFQAISFVVGIFTSIGSVVGSVVTAIGSLAGVAGTAATAIGGGLVASLAAIPPTTFLAIGAAVAIAAAGFALLATQSDGVSTILSALGSAVVSVIAAIASGLTQVLPVLADALSQVVSSVSDGISQVSDAVSSVLDSISDTVTSAADGISSVLSSLSDTFTSFGTAVSDVLDSASGVITSFGDSVRNILDGVAGIFDSMGNAALNAGTGMQSMANGIAQIVALPILDMSASLAAVATGMTAIAANGTGMAEVGAAMTALTTAIVVLTTGSVAATSAFTQFASVVGAAGASFEPVTAQITAFTAAISALTGPIGAVTSPMASFSGEAVVGAAAAGTLAAGMGVAAVASGTLSGSLKSASSALGGVGRNASSAGKGLSSVARTGQSVKSTLSSMQKTAQAAMAVLSKSFATVGKNAEKSGKQVGDGFSKRLQAGLKKGASLSQTEGRLIGTRFTTALKGSISKANSIASQAVSAMAARIRAGRGAAYSAGSYVGLGVAAGMRSALPAVTAAANAIIAQVNRAMRARAKIHSPSDLTAEIGEYLTQGVIKGLEKLMPAAKKSSEGLIDKILNAAEKATGNKTIGSMLLNPYQKIGSVTGNAKKMISTYAAKLKKATSAAKGGYKSIGTTLNKAFESTLTSGQKTLLKKGNTAIQSLTDKYYGTTGINKTIAKNKKTIKKLQLANKTASAATKKANTKRINELQKDNNKLSDKTKKQQKKSDKLSTQIYSQYEKYVKSATTKAINAAQSAITKLTEKYQEMYDKVIEKRTSFYNTLSSVGDLYTVDDYGYLAFKDFKAAKKQVDAYSKNIEKLKKLLPDGLMEEILSMDTAKGLEYTNQLLKKSEAQIKAYGKDYTAFINSAAKASNTYYQPQLDAIKKQFNAAATKEMETLKKQMDQIGQDSVTGFINGIAKKNKKLKKAAKAMGLTVSGTVKKILGIKSPSRIFAAIGQYVGKGYIKGMDSMRRKIQKTSVRMVDIPTAQRPRLAFAGGDLSDEYDYNSQIKYEITVVSEIDGRQVAKATAKPMEEEMSKRAAREQRKNGKKS